MTDDQTAAAVHFLQEAEIEPNTLQSIIVSVRGALSLDEVQ